MAKQREVENQRARVAVPVGDPMGSAALVVLLAAAVLVLTAGKARAGDAGRSAPGLLAELIPGEVVPEGELETIYGRGVNVRALGVIASTSRETFASVESSTVSEIRSTLTGEVYTEVRGASAGSGLRVGPRPAVRRPGGTLGVRSPAAIRDTVFRSPNGNILGGGAQLRGVTRTPAAASSIGLGRVR